MAENIVTIYVLVEDERANVIELSHRKRKRNEKSIRNYGFTIKVIALERSM